MNGQIVIVDKKANFRYNGVDVMLRMAVHPNMLIVDEKSTEHCE
jgi:hypothetical protein